MPDRKEHGSPKDTLNFHYLSHIQLEGEEEELPPKPNVSYCNICHSH